MPFSNVPPLIGEALAARGYAAPTPVQAAVLEAEAHGPRPDRLRADRIGQDRRLRPRHGAAIARRAWPPAVHPRAARAGDRADPRARAAGQPRARMALCQGRGAHRDLRRRHGRVARAPPAQPGRADRRRHARPPARPSRARRARPSPTSRSSSSTRPTRCSTWASARISRRSSTRPRASAARCCSRRRCPSRSSRSPSATSATRCASRPSARIAAMATSPIRRSRSPRPTSSTRWSTCCASTRPKRRCCSAPPATMSAASMPA